MASLDLLTQYHRLYKQPIDDMEVFKNIKDLMTYCRSGAWYNGQRVVVDTLNNKPVEYVIRNGIPIIDMRGSEPIFRWFEDKQSHYLMLYEHNGGPLNTWNETDVFTFEDGKLCLISQAHIFGIYGASATPSYVYYMEVFNKVTNHIDASYNFTQNFDVFTDGPTHAITQTAGASVNSLSYNSNSEVWLKSNNSSYKLMPRTTAAAGQEQNRIIRIYIKADEYYKAYWGR